MTPPSPESAEPMVAIVISAVALLVSGLVWLSSLRNGRRQRQMMIGQKRNQILLAMLDVELSLDVSMRDLNQMLSKLPASASQLVQPRLDKITGLLARVQSLKQEVADQILPNESSHKALLWLEPTLGEALELVERIRVLEATIETGSSELIKLATAKHEP